MLFENNASMTADMANDHVQTWPAEAVIAQTVILAHTAVLLMLQAQLPCVQFQRGG